MGASEVLIRLQALDDVPGDAQLWSSSCLTDLILRWERLLYDSVSLSRHQRAGPADDPLGPLLGASRAQVDRLDVLWAGPGRLVFSAGPFLGSITYEAYDNNSIFMARQG